MAGHSGCCQLGAQLMLFPQNIFMWPLCVAWPSLYDNWVLRGTIQRLSIPRGRKWKVSGQWQTMLGIRTTSLLMYLLVLGPAQIYS